MRYSVAESNLPGFWLVEAYNERGECLRAVFSGPDAEQRARAYAWERSRPAEWIEGADEACPRAHP